MATLRPYTLNQRYYYCHLRRTLVASGADVAALFAGLQIGHSLET